ncbi:putative amidoligase enzyme-domain-containing protein [Hypoxylon sp. NC1633]|nr:putative amidoligase enzyme-domain-containing protein [Hypoxylon sp. NC1633]
MANRETNYSFGVEMEFYIGWVRADSTDAVHTPSQFRSRPGAGPFVVSDPDPGEGEVHDELEATILEFLQDNPPDTVVPQDMVDIENDRKWSHLGRFRRWQVVPDVTLTQNLDRVFPREVLEACNWAAVEVVSPALWATQKGFDDVARVASFLHRKFWTMTPRFCGTHVHVGFGNHWLPMESARKVAAFLYAADPILAQTHPVHRRNNHWCRSPRLYSNLSFGQTMIDVRNVDDHEEDEEQHDDDDHEEYDVEYDEYNDGPSQSQAPNDPGTLIERFSRMMGKKPARPRPARNEFPPRPREVAYTADPERIAIMTARDEPWMMECDPYRFKPVPLMPAVGELLHATNRAMIYELLQTGQMPSAYSFRQFSFEIKRTIEFRMPAGSVEPVEIVSQARVAVRLVQFAAAADLNHLLRIISDFEEAESNPRYYDVYDLFLDLGLRPEARVLHAALAGTLNDTIRTNYCQSRGHQITP